MSGVRPIVQDVGGLSRASRAGDGVINPILTEVATDAAVTITVAQLATGFINYTSFSAGRNVTTPTAALIIAAFPQLDIGDSIEVVIASEAAFAGTFVAGTDVTLNGKATVAASSHVHVIITKTSATTVTWSVL